MLAAYIPAESLDIQSILLILGMVMNTILGILIFARRRNEYVNQIYVINIICIVWWSVMILFYRFAQAHLLAWTIGLYVAPTFIASTFLYFTFFFPEEHPRVPFRRPYLFFIFGLNSIIVALTLIPGVIIQSVEPVVGAEKIIHFGFLYLAYAAYISGFFGLGLLILAQKLLLVSDRVKRRQLAYLLWGYLLASTLAMVTNLTLPYLGYFTLNWLGQVLTVFMVLPVTYAIFKHRLFDVKVIATEILTITLWLFLFARLLLDTSTRERIIDGALFVTVIIIGWLLIRSVDREVRLRELIEKQEKELEVVNKQQENLLHFISHEIKGYLTKSQGGFAGIVEGDYGEIGPKLKEMATTALADVRKGVATVMQILEASNMKRGTVRYAKKLFDLKNTVRATVADLKSSAEEKNLKIEVTIGEGKYVMTGDEERMRGDVVRNLIDNAIKYSPSGTILVTLTDSSAEASAKADGDLPALKLRQAGKIRFSVKDNGVGIIPEDMARLFTEGGHGKDSIKINVHSTGYGLFIAKQIVEAHGGKIWAESGGAGKGATFLIELPTA